MAGAQNTEAQSPETPEFSGEVVLVRGVLKVRRRQAERIFRTPGVKIPVTKEDVIHTGADTRARVTLFATEETIDMYSNSHLRIAEYSKEETGIVLNVGKALFDFARRLGLGRKVLVETRVMVVGVKGTRFVVGVEEDEAYALTLEGKLGVTLTGEPQREIDVGPDQMFFVTEQGAPREAVPVTPEVRDRIVQEEGLEAFKEVAGEALAQPIDKEPAGYFFRIGLATETLAFDYRGSGGAKASQSLTSSAVLMGWNFKLFGPINLDTTFTLGNIESVDIDVRDGPPSGDDTLGADTRGAHGEFRVASISLAYRMTLGNAFTWSAGAGRFVAWAEYKSRGADSAGRTHTVNVRGVQARVTAETVFGNDGTLGLFILRGIGAPQGTDINAAKRAGFKPKDAEFTIVALTVGRRF